MTSQMVAHYNCERLCNRLARAKPFQNLQSPIIEGYFPKLTLENSSMAYGIRMANTHLFDTTRDDSHVAILELERWFSRIYDAINTGYVLQSDGEKQKKLNREPSPGECAMDTGINILGNLVVS
jgi:tyrosinase